MPSARRTTRSATPAARTRTQLCERTVTPPIRKSTPARATTTVVAGNCVKVISWYDNEWGYSCRVRDLISFMAKKGL